MSPQRKESSEYPSGEGALSEGECEGAPSEGGLGDGGCCNLGSLRPQNALDVTGIRFHCRNLYIELGYREDRRGEPLN